MERELELLAGSIRAKLRLTSRDASRRQTIQTKRAINECALHCIVSFLMMPWRRRQLTQSTAMSRALLRRLWNPRNTLHLGLSKDIVSEAIAIERPNIRGSQLLNLTNERLLRSEVNIRIFN